MSTIFRPELPPKAGYVEVLNADGNHVYKPTAETAARLQKEKDAANLQTSVNCMLGTSAEGSTEAIEFRKAVQLFAVSITDEAQIMQIATVYPEYQVGMAYKIKDIFRYGENSVGDPQLYQVLQAHTSAAEWTPDTATSLYKKIGVTEEGIPEWVQPLGATDAYEYGDIVMHNGVKYRSTYEGANVWEPGVYGWEVVTDETE